jgi:hypothetical protein
MLNQFKRQAHHYVTDIPPYAIQYDQLEWLALMQHYGAPTRLLDFTYSFYVAAFFAIERASRDAAIWAVHLRDLSAAVTERTGWGSIMETEEETAEKREGLLDSSLKGGRTDKLVVDVEPFRMNERVAIQQGIFLAPCDLTAPFEDNLAATFNARTDAFDEHPEPLDAYDSSIPSATIYKVILSRGIHEEAVADLRTMNVTSATLFPGLDGFARSLYFDLRML